MYLFFLFFLILSPIFAVRWLRWLAIVQQKEYRLDRLNSFLSSAEGKTDFWRLVPKLKDFTRTGLKRPIRTSRAMVIGGISVVILLMIWLVSASLGWIFLLASFVATYLFLPFVVILACFPTALISATITIIFLMKAKMKIAKAKPKIIGIGGSYGKTSTKHLLHHVLSRKFTVFVTPKSHNTKYSVAKSIYDSFSDQQIAILEYGAYKIGEIQYLTEWFPPDLAIETGFTLQHLGLFGSVENSLHAESELVAALPEKAKVFCNAADENALKICEIGRKKNHAEVVPYSGQTSHIRLQHAELNEMGELSFSFHQHQVQTRVVGTHYLENIQGVICVAQEMGLSDDEIAQGLASFVPNSNFIRTSIHKTGALIIDDGGTTNPMGFMAALQLMKVVTKKHSILITSGIVDLAEESSRVHQDLAEKAKDIFDQVLYLGSDGKEEFQKVFGAKMLTDQSVILDMLSKVDGNTIILLEGKMPKWLNQFLTV